MRITGNGIIFTAIAAAGVILLAVAARMSTLAAELEHMQHEYDQRSSVSPTNVSTSTPSVKTSGIPPLLDNADNNADSLFTELREAEQLRNAQEQPAHQVATLEDPSHSHQNHSSRNQEIPATEFFRFMTGERQQEEEADRPTSPATMFSVMNEKQGTSTTPFATMTTTATGSATTGVSTLKSKTATTAAVTTTFRLSSVLETLPQEIKNDSWPFSGILYNPKSPCLKAPKAVSAVLTLPKERKARDWLREQIKNMTDGRVIPVFPLGRPPQHRGIHDEDEVAANESRFRLEQSLLEEAHEKDDLIIADFVDSYEDLSRKSMLVFDWFAKTCNDKVRWLIKEDVDVVVNWKHLLDGLELIERDGAKQDLLSDTTRLKPPKILRADKDPIWLGHRWVGMPVIHDPRHRNFEEIPLDEFPPYCSGPSYIMNSITVNHIIEARKKDIRYYRNEDAMLGLLLYGKAVPIHDERFIVFIGSDWRMAACRKETESISECECSRWWTYHCGGHKAEREAALQHSYQCANKPFFADTVQKISKSR